MADTLWTGSQADKLYKQSGFTSTQLDSIAVTAIDTAPYGISWDDTDTYWCGDQADKLYKQSGFTSTQKTSVDVSGVDTTPSGITWDGTDTLWTGDQANKLYKNSGFTSTQKTSIDISAVDTAPNGIGWDGTDTLWGGNADNKLYKTSGFTSTVKDSVDISGIDVTPTGVSWNGFDALWTGNEAQKLYKQSGFSSTNKDSIDVSGVDNVASGIGHGNYAERIGTAPANIFYKTHFQKGTRIKHRSKADYTVPSPLLLSPERNVVHSNVIYEAATRGDALRLEVTGVEIKSLKAVYTLPGIEVKRAAGRNGPGTGYLRSADDGTLLSWKAPGSDTFGSTVRCATDQSSYILEDGLDRDKWIRVKIHTSFIVPGSAETKVELEEVFENGVSHDDVTGPEASAGDVVAYEITMANDGPMDMLDFHAWLSKGTVHNGIEIRKTIADTLWCGGQARKLYKQSAFTSTLKDSVDVIAVDTRPSGISWDDTNTYWSGDTDDKLYKNSGFTSTQLDSIDVSAVDANAFGITWDGTNTLWCGYADDKLYKQSAFTSTLKTSIDVSGVDLAPVGISWNSADTLWVGSQKDKLYKNSGFTSTQKTSVAMTTIDNSPAGISWNGCDVIWCGTQGEKLYKNSGFTSTQKTSIDVSGVDNSPYGIGHGDYAERVCNAQCFTPDFEDHVNVLEWTRIAAGASEPLYLRRTIESGEDTPESKALDFDGSDHVDFGDITALDGATEITFAGWFYSDGHQTDPTAGTILSKYTNIGNNRALGINMYSNDKIQFAVYDGIGTDRDFQWSDAGVPIDQWVHIAITWKGNPKNIDIHINGSEIASTYTPTGTPPTSFPNVTAKLYMGAFEKASTAPDFFFRGYFDEWAIWTEILSNNDISDLYNSGAGYYIDKNNDWPTDGGSIGTNLIALWHMDEGTGDTTADSSAQSHTGTLNPGSGEPAWVNGKVSSSDPPPTASEGVLNMLEFAWDGY